MRIATDPNPRRLPAPPPVFGDEPGFFMEIYHTGTRWPRRGWTSSFVQDNYSRSRRGVLRGLHYQSPHAQGKLVRVTRGAVYDVAVDIRVGIAGICRWIGQELEPA